MTSQLDAARLWGLNTANIIVVKHDEAFLNNLYTNKARKEDFSQITNLSKEVK